MPIYFYIQQHEALSNFSAHAIEIDGIVYPTSEHAYQAAKCMSPEGKKKIIAARSPLSAKKISNDTYKAAKDPEWETKKVAIMESILRVKLAQHQEVYDVVTQSGIQELIEDSKVDYFWGRGQDGSGQNQLGKLWMKIRAEIIARL